MLSWIVSTVTIIQYLICSLIIFIIVLLLMLIQLPFCTSILFVVKYKKEKKVHFSLNKPSIVIQCLRSCSQFSSTDNIIHFSLVFQKLLYHNLNGCGRISNSHNRGTWSEGWWGLGQPMTLYSSNHSLLTGPSRATGASVS